MSGVATPSYVSGLVKAGLVRPKRRLGQNFLVDGNVLDHLVDVVRPQGRGVLEIGAGLGALTLALAQAGAATVVAVEKDRVLAAILGENVAGSPQVSVVVGDALELDWAELAREVGGRTGAAEAPVVAGNLPYSITTPLLFKLLVPPLFWERAVIMVQLEVAERILAGPRTKDYGSLTLAVAAVATAHMAFRVGPRSFYPAPTVDTAVLRLERRKEAAGGLDPSGLSRLSTIVRAAFGQRRKTLANALAAGLGRGRSEVASRLAVTGIDPIRRGETLTLDEFVLLEKTFRDLVPAT